ncbi:conserved hypothetical protein [Perkinsus marinus ATCC 50983]|uniref:Wbp11/ELF5/Saf1 N-terminal domain-containing protein n=1 Tax=Perkinsus marinus (strain ATCC 50983 / TXsc) TaxID=423536 RepID=C5KS38_PERM5|nr:conserved hypothetical protein [Perkinsus marinus ATCC 50983]EER12729.1 conserved hypothetical protein [Perkinsus marinus ATCC 50983]|eukprot:XP_002780934.1 conserved hypothetical protein [Perkinsus marinus ATCC 50983]
MGGKRERKARNPAEQQRRLEKRREKAKIKKNRLSALESWLMKNSPSQVEESIKSLERMLKRARKEGRLAYRPDFDISHKLSQLESAYERLKPRMMTMDKKRKELESARATRKINADWADPASKARRKAKMEAKYSVYYDERFNPFGIPPPGKQTLFRHKDGTLHNYPPPDITDDEEDSSDESGDDEDTNRIMRERAAALQRKRADSSNNEGKKRRKGEEIQQEEEGSTKEMPTARETSDPYKRARQAAAAAAQAAEERARKDEAAKKAAILQRFDTGNTSGVVAQAKAVKPQLKLFVPSQVRGAARGSSSSSNGAPPELLTLDSDKVHIKKAAAKDDETIPHKKSSSSIAPPTGSFEDDFDRFMGEVDGMGKD